MGACASKCSKKEKREAPAAKPQSQPQPKPAAEGQALQKPAAEEQAAEEQAPQKPAAEEAVAPPLAPGATPMKRKKSTGDAVDKNAADGGAAAAAGLTDVADLIPAEVYMFSGCEDKQTSADVKDTTRFDLPEAVGVAGAGGACTNALLSFVGESDYEGSIGETLVTMNDYLMSKGYKQRPMLSSSRRTGMDAKFSVCGGQTGTKWALLMGINYASHSKGRLSGCVNDVLAMQRFLKTQGFEEKNMRVLVDVDHEKFATKPEMPNKKEILAAIKWITDVAQPGDSVFVHYSGHGVQVEDKSGDESDGLDEALVPNDYQKAGLILDDDMLAKLVMPLRGGVRMMSVMDCCHSGSILDLPYSFAATDDALLELAANPCIQTAPNPSFAVLLLSFGKEKIDELVQRHPKLSAPFTKLKGKLRL